MDDVQTQWVTWDKVDEPEYWWWWDGDGYPVPVYLMRSGFTGKLFASAGQHGWNRAQELDEMGGWWMRLPEPETPVLQIDEDWDGDE